MLSVKINDVKYFLPEGWNEIKFGKFLDIARIVEKASEYTNYNQYVVKLISCVMEAPYEVVADLDQEDLLQLIDNMQWAYDLTPDNNFKKHINLNGIDYAFKDNMKLKMSETITMETIIKQNGNDNVSSFPLVLACLLRPAKKSVVVETGEDLWIQDPLDEDFEALQKRADIFKEHIMVNDVYGALVFFSNIVTNSLMKPTETSSTTKIKIEKVNS